MVKAHVVEDGTDGDFEDRSAGALRPHRFITGVAPQLEWDPSVGYGGTALFTRIRLPDALRRDVDSGAIWQIRLGGERDEWRALVRQFRQRRQLDVVTTVSS